jgi:hypothetical protein
MRYVVYILFQVMHFHHNRSIVTIAQLAYDNHHPNSTLLQATPLYVPSICVDSTSPHVNYVAYCPSCSIASEKELVHSCFPSQDMVLAIDHYFIPWGHGTPYFPLLVRVVLSLLLSLILLFVDPQALVLMIIH